MMEGSFHFKWSLEDLLKFVASGEFLKQAQKPQKRVFGGPLPLFTGPKTAKKAAQRVNWDRRDKELLVAAYSTNPTLENLNALIAATIGTPP